MNQALCGLLEIQGSKAEEALPCWCLWKRDQREEKGTVDWSAQSQHRLFYGVMQRSLTIPKGLKDSLCIPAPGFMQ